MHTHGFDFDFGLTERKGVTLLTGQIQQKWISGLWRSSEERKEAVLFFLFFTACGPRGTHKMHPKRQAENRQKYFIYFKL